MISKQNLIQWMRQCANCGRMYGACDLFCELCWSQLLALQAPHWRVLEKRMGVFSLWNWSQQSPGLIGNTIYAYKGGRLPKASRTLAFEILRSIKHIPKNETVTFVPIPTRQVDGYDHAFELAQTLAEMTQSRCKQPLLWVSSHSPQKRKSKQERQLSFRRREKVHGRVILIDDVITTGHTLAAAYDALKTKENCIFGICLVDRLKT